jgi:hypothetical protein
MVEKRDVDKRCRIGRRIPDGRYQVLYSLRQRGLHARSWRKGDKRASHRSFLLESESRQTEWVRVLEVCARTSVRRLTKALVVHSRQWWGCIARPYSRSISAVNQWRLDEQLRHFFAELSSYIAGTSSSLIIPSGTDLDIRHCRDTSKHASISPGARL